MRALLLVLFAAAMKSTNAASCIWKVPDASGAVVTRTVDNFADPACCNKAKATPTELPDCLKGKSFTQTFSVGGTACSGSGCEVAPGASPTGANINSQEYFGLSAPWCTYFQERTPPIPAGGLPTAYCVKETATVAGAVTSVAADIQAKPVLHEAPELPEGWQRLESPVPDDHLITVRFSLQQQNIDELQRTVLRVSDPRSSSYGQYLTGAEVRELTAPSAAHISLVENWLAAAEVEVLHRGDEELEVTVTALIAAKLFSCKFNRVSNEQSGQQAIQAHDYWLPADIDAAVAAVYGLHGLPLPPRQFTQFPPTPKEPAKVTPAIIDSTYSVTGKGSSSQKNKMAVAEFQGQTMKKSDLTKFFTKFVPDAPKSADQVSKFVGKKPLGDGGIEASLDIEYIMGVAPSVLAEFWYWGGNDFCGDLKLWTSAIINASADAPRVFSVSYGWQGQLKQIGCKTSKVTDVDNNFAKIAAMGISIIFASGDSGSGYSPLSTLSTKPKKPKLYPSWPASSPWITAVGSTRFVNQKVGQPEMATDQFGSGGGFSTMFEAFKDQQAAVKQYLSIAKDLPPAGSYPAGGRATPDVSALGEGFQVIANGETQSVGGTSASAPTFAAIVSLLNDARIKAGKPAMGYLNPFLYQNPDAFTDITVGTDKIGRGGEKLKYGFDCAKGWDPVTGLGTPIYTKLLAAAMKATAEQVVV